MSQHGTKAEDTEGSDETIELADPDDYHRSQRLKEIHQARQRVHDTLDSFDKAAKKPEATHQCRKLAYAVSMYVSELEPLILDTDADATLPNRYPWDTALQYADALGKVPDDFDHPATYAPKANSIQVFRLCNKILADVKPLVEADDTDEWEV